MTSWRWVLLFFFTLSISSSPGEETGSTASSHSDANLSDSQWESAVTHFESSIPLLISLLEKEQSHLKELQADIGKLEQKTAMIRQSSPSGSNVFDEIRLKGLLNELKGKLEENSNLQKEWEGKQKEFEQQALSLVALYNDKIEKELETPGTSAGEPGLNSKVNYLASLIAKRNRIQTQLSKYQKKPEEEAFQSVGAISNLKHRDKESLQLTLDLCKDRKKDLEEQIERWSLEMEDIRNELKLQGKMQEFLEDIHQLNEDSDAPRGGIKDSDMESVVGKRKRNKLEARLTELQMKFERGQRTISQINSLMTNVQRQLQLLNERK